MSPLKVLMYAHRHDPHALAVRWGLRRLGIEPLLFSSNEYPVRTSGTLQISRDGQLQNSLTMDAERYAAPFDVIWNRRRPMPTAKPGTHPADIAMVRGESVAYLQNAAELNANGHTLWVNSLEAQRRANLKIPNLLIAKDLGFKVPATLVTNEHREVLEFASVHKRGIVAKSFLPGGWMDASGRPVVLRTAKLEEADLEAAAPIERCPMIYQEQIDKSYEYRVTVIGVKVFAFAILTAHDASIVDWRTDARPSEIGIEARHLPAPVSAACLALCRRLGLVFGCIDIMVTPAGDHVFLEVNEGGQFLWLEERCQDVSLLAEFCSFIATRGGDTPSVHLPTIRLADFHATSEWLSHVELRPSGTLDESERRVVDEAAA